MNTHIETHIAFSSDLNIGAEYNRLISHSKSNWILLLDHDVLLVNPEWYYICQQAISQYPDAALFTCYCNAYTKHDGNVNQRYDAPSLNDPVLDHRLFAKKLFVENQFSCRPFSGNSIGFFMLISKEKWHKAGGFRPDGIFGVDFNFVNRLRQNKFQTIIIEGLYTLHLHYRDGTWIKNKKSTKELWEEYVNHKKNRVDNQ